MRVVISVWWLLAPALVWGQGVAFRVRPEGSKITYRLVHKLHEFSGSSSKIEGAVAVRGESLLVQVRADAASFDSGNANRDAHMKETIETHRFPHVTVKGTMPAIEVPKTFPAEVRGEVVAEVAFHGVTRRYPVPVTVSFVSASTAQVKATFSLSLEAHGIERPSLMFVKVEDALTIEADLALVKP